MEGKGGGMSNFTQNGLLARNGLFPDKKGACKTC